MFKNIILSFLIISFNASSLTFNSNELFILEGKTSELANDEGYLLLSLDNNEKIDNIIIKAVKKGNTFKFKDIVSGENFALLKVKAGEYYWAVFWYYFKAGHVRYNYKKTDFTFKVEPGVINYPGTWSADLKFTGYRRAYQLFESINKSAYELAKLRKSHKEIFSNYPFKFQGSVEDSYADYYKEISKTISGNMGHEEKSYISYDVKQGISKELKSFNNIQTYLDDLSQSVGSFSPNGRYLFFKLVNEGISYIRVLNLSTYNMVTILKNKLPKFSYVDDIEWIDDNSIYYSVYYDGINNHRVAHLKINKDYQIIGAQHLDIPTKGLMVDSLLKEENMLYFSKNSIYSSKKNGIYKINVSTNKTIKKSVKKPFKVIKKFEDAVYYLTGIDGEVRFIMTSEYNKKEDSTILDYWFLPINSDWVKIHSVSSNQETEIQLPRMISKDNKHLFVMTNKFGDKVSIHKYSTKDFSHQGVFYENDNLELTGVEYDSLTKEIIGVKHTVNGFPKVKYFESSDDNLKPLRKKYPNHKFYETQYNKIINKALVYGTNEYSKGSWSIYNIETGENDKLFETNPKYNNLPKGNFLNINIKASDGVDLEGYLVVPKKSKGNKFPLVVIPHGGPIGVRDYAYNSDVQHFYASHGVATLKVNYRGSGGFGKEFEASGQKQWGKKIESDINEMVDYVVEYYNVSNDQICTMGSSYGGYSAIMLTILYPDRYKCAVSLAGVMDIPLMFTSSDFRKSDKVVEKFKEIVGDPMDKDQNLIGSSPLYLVNEITKPILLFHGASDKRVTPEHSIRMKELLDMTNKQSELIMLENEGHSFNNIESEVVYIARSLEFIKKNLELK